MERKIGDSFEYEGKIFKVEEDKNFSCHRCFFNKKCTVAVKKTAGQCQAGFRGDNKDVVFVKVAEGAQTEEPKERKIGEVFEYQRTKLQVVKDEEGSCDKCFFFKEDNCRSRNPTAGICNGYKRTDKKPVIFVEVKDEQPQEQAEQPKLNLCEILKDCPKGTKLYSTTLGYVIFQGILAGAVYPITVTCENGAIEDFTADGKMFIDYDGECTLFPSKEQRSWANFIAPWLKKERFDPKTLKAFDRVLVRLDNLCQWRCSLFSNAYKYNGIHYLCTSGNTYKQCIPYNDDTKHLVGTTDEAPEFYRYWED